MKVELLNVVFMNLITSLLNKIKATENQEQVIKVEHNASVFPNSPSFSTLEKKSLGNQKLSAGERNRPFKYSDVRLN